MEHLDLFDQFRATRSLAFLEEVIGLEALSTEQQETDPDLLSVIDRDLERALGIICQEGIWVSKVVGQNSETCYKIFTKGLTQSSITSENRDTILSALPSAETLVQYVASSARSLIDERDIVGGRVRVRGQQVAAGEAGTQNAVSRRICLEIGIGFGLAVATLNPLAVGFTAGLALGYGCSP